MSKANKDRIKNLSDVNFKRMVLIKRRRGTSGEFRISHLQIDVAIQSFLNRGGQITKCKLLDQPPGMNFAGEGDNFLMGV